MQADGFVKGRPVALFVLDYGLFKVHSNGRVIGICGYLIQTDAGENILVDTGFPAKYAADKQAATQQDRLYEFGEVLECTPANLPTAQLALVGITPDDVALHIVTHTHIDHIGGLGDFPNVPILMSAIERALPRPLYWGQIQPIDWPDQDYLLIENDTAVGPGLGLLVVPGHAPGQLALMIDLPETGHVLLTGDAISRPAEIEEQFAGSWDEEQACASADRLMQMASETDALIIYGHSPDQWPGLRKAPERFT